jgi:hypothetical protein
MPTYRFPAQEVLALIRDAKAHKNHFLTFGERLDIFGEDKFAPQPDEETRGKAGLWLVKDEGVYLMSNSHPKRMGPVYAKGYGPTKHVGGDDYVEFLPLIEEEFLVPGATVEIKMTATRFTISVVAAPVPLEPRPDESIRDFVISYAHPNGSRRSRLSNQTRAFLDRLFVFCQDGYGKPGFVPPRDWNWSDDAFAKAALGIRRAMRI